MLLRLLASAAGERCSGNVTTKAVQKIVLALCNTCVLRLGYANHMEISSKTGAKAENRYALRGAAIEGGD